MKNTIDNEELKIMSLELQTEISKLKKALSKFETNIGILQTGDKNGPYWNGTNAYDMLVSCVGNFEHNMYLLGNLEKCSDYIASIKK